MKEYKGILGAIGSGSSARNYSTYDYIDLGDCVLKKQTIHHGLDAKLSSSLGKSVTLYVSAGHILAIKTANDRLFGTDTSLLLSLILGIFALVMGLGTLIASFSGGAGSILYFLPALFSLAWAYVLLRFAHALMSMRKLPGVILI